MGAPLQLSEGSLDVIAEFALSLQNSGLTAWNSTMGAARTLSGRMERADGWQRADLDTQVAWMRQARPFVSWMLVTGQITATADFIAVADLKLGVTAKGLLPRAHAWFLRAAGGLDASRLDATIQWNVLCKIAAMSAVSPDLVDEAALGAIPRSARSARLTTR